MHPVIYRARYLLLVQGCFLILGWSGLSGQTLGTSDTLGTVTPAPSNRSLFDIQWTERKIIGVIFSTILPGTGQSYLGHSAKGALFTVGTFGGALVTGISENNVVGRNERLQEFFSQYKVSTSYQEANDLWDQVLATKDLLDKDKRRRDLFLRITVALWVANIVDVVLFTEDQGEKTFGAVESPQTSFGVAANAQNGLNFVMVVRF